MCIENHSTIMPAKKFMFSEKRYLLVKKHEGQLTVSIIEDGTDKSARFPLGRWVQFVRTFGVVDENLKILRQGKAVKLQLHVGGRWHVSVTTGINCVDVREFYWHPMLGMKPRKHGIALRLGEWDKFNAAVNEMHAANPTVDAAIPCADQSDHFNLEGALSCIECNPFHCDLGFDFRTEPKSDS